MKTKLQVWILLFIGSFTTLFAQTPSQVEELLSRLDQNHMGAVSSVFTSEEMNVLRTHFQTQNGAFNSTAPRVTTGEVFAPENVSGDFGHFQTSSPDVYNVIGPSGTMDFEGAGTFIPGLGLFYVVDNAGNAYSLDPNTGNYTLLHTVTPPAGESITGLEFDPTTSTIYAISTNGEGQSTLSTIDPFTGALTQIGDTGLVLAIALAVNLSGALFAFDIDTDIMYILNKVNAQATALGSIGIDSSFGQGMFLDPISGFIYLTAFNNTAFRSELRMLNTDTGATTLISPIGSTSPGGTLQFAWSGLDKVSLGTSENALSNIAVYPNPTRDLLQVSASEVIEKVVVYNVLGQELLLTKANGLETTVDVSSLESGSYYLRININGEQITKPFIKQ